MLKFNQIGVAANPYQGNTPRVLCVCSAGVLRSPTIAQYLSTKGFNTRAAGASEEYALIPISPQLYYWADVIVTVFPKRYIERTASNWNVPSRARGGEVPSASPKYVELLVDDVYVYNSPDLLAILETSSLTEKILEQLGEGND